MVAAGPCTIYHMPQLPDSRGRLAVTKRQNVPRGNGGDEVMLDDMPKAGIPQAIQQDEARLEIAAEQAGEDPAILVELQPAESQLAQILNR